VKKEREKLKVKTAKKRKVLKRKEGGHSLTAYDQELFETLRGCRGTSLVITMREKRMGLKGRWCVTAFLEENRGCSIEEKRVRHVLI